MTNYVLEGPKWGSGELGTAGGTVTWAIDSSIPVGFAADIEAAFAVWSKYANIQFEHVASTSTSMIDFTFAPIDGANRVLGETYYFYSGTTMRAATVEFDSSEGWQIANGHGKSANGASFFLVALHEIGHTLGLDHFNGTASVMNTYLNSSSSTLFQSDIDGIQAIYGPSTVAVSPPPTGGQPPVDQGTPSVGGPAAGSVSHVASDLNGDGTSDIVWRGSNGDVVYWDHFGTNGPSGATLGNVGTNWTISNISDFDGDGRSDMLWRSSGGDVVIWDQISNGTHGGSSLGIVGTNWNVAGTADFNGDGNADILWRASNGDVAIWDNISNGTHGGASYGNVGNEWKIAATGDFDGDHKADILWRASNGDLVIWNNIADGTHGGTSLGNVGNSWHIAGTGDFNGDGKSDILWRSNAGDVVTWENIDANGGHTGQSLGNVGLAWDVQNVGDYSGDGKADILWRANNGDVVIWDTIANDTHGGQSLGNVGLSWDVHHQYDLAA